MFRRNLAALDEATGVTLDWNPRPRGIVSALSISPDSLVVYAGGSWDTISDLGADYFDRLNVVRLKPYHTRRLEELGFQVTVEEPRAA